MGLLCAPFLAACSSAPAPAPAEAPVTTAEQPAPAADELVMSGIKLYLYQGEAIPGQERSPSFSVEAEEFVQEADRTWRFKQAKATVPPREEGQSAIVFDAGTGQLREEESALLEGGVKATVGTMTIEMQNVQWLQVEAKGQGMAFSDLPVSVTDATMNLFAQQFRLYPADAQFLLMEVNGEVSFAPPQQEGAPAEGASAPDAAAAPAQEGNAAS